MSDDKNELQIMVMTESVCDFDKGEYSVFITAINKGWIGEDDFNLIDEWVMENLSTKALPQEGCTSFTLIETGEWEDVNWFKYYELKNKLEGALQ